MGPLDRRFQHRIRARCKCFGNVAAHPHAAICDHLHPPPSFPKVRFARRRHVAGGGHLRDADAQHTSSGARGPGPNPDQDAGDASPHQFERRLVLDAVSGDDWDVDTSAERIERELLVRARDVSGGQDRSLHHQAARSRLLHETSPAAGMGRNS